MKKACPRVRRPILSQLYVIFSLSGRHIGHRGAAPNRKLYCAHLRRATCFFLPPSSSSFGRVLIPILYYVHLVHYVAAHRTTQDCFSPAPTLFFNAGAGSTIASFVWTDGERPFNFFGSSPTAREKFQAGNDRWGKNRFSKKKRGGRRMGRERRNLPFLLLSNDDDYARNPVLSVVIK